MLALLLLAITLITLLANISHLVSDAKEGVLASCQGVQGAADVLVSLPHYMADGVNELNQKSAKDVVAGAADVLDIALLSIEAIAIFIVDMYRSLFVCLLNLVVHGTIDLFINATEEAQLFVNSALQAARSDVQVAIAGINSGLISSINLLDTLPGVHISPPAVDAPALPSLSNLTLPSTILSSLVSLNNSLPTLSQLRDDLDAFISHPIELLRSEIKSTLQNSTVQIAVLPSPAKSTVEICSNLDVAFIDRIGEDLAKFVRIALMILAAVALLLALVGTLWERYRYYAHLRGVERARAAWKLDLALSTIPDSTSTSNTDSLSTSHLLSFLGKMQHPLLSLLIAKLGVYTGLSTKRRDSIHWFGSYILHPSALVFLILGVVGLITVSIEISLLQGPARSLAQGQIVAGVANFANTTRRAINDEMNSTSIKYAIDSNKILLGVQNDINHNLFGWVNTTTTAMNSTINMFYNGLTSAVHSTFVNTPLDHLALNLIDCLIGSKVRGIEAAITFLQSHAHLTLPTVSPTALLLSPDRINELTAKVSTSNGPLSSTGVVERMIDRYAQTLQTQRMGFVVCLAVWGLVLLMGSVGTFWREREERKGKKSAPAAAGAAGEEVEMEKSSFNSSSAPVTYPRMMQVSRSTVYRGQERKQGGDPFATPFDE